MQLYKILSILLSYPNQELIEHLTELEQSIGGLKGASEADQEILHEFLNTLKDCSLTELQADYVQTFDLTADHSLHLTHHLYEEQDRARGPTLVNLIDYFKSTGLELKCKELPDYLPLLLEYASTLEDELSARVFLRETSPACATIADKLEEAGSPYAPLLRLVERHGHMAESKSAVCI